MFIQRTQKTMNPQIKQKWIDALRSGEYVQGYGQLRSEDNKFCCLGVLGDIYSKEKRVEWEKNYSGLHTIEGQSAVLNKKVIEWAGLTYGPWELTLTRLNDGIVLCSEKPDKCKIEYNYLKLKETQK